jgi:hypothetical protein
MKILEEEPPLASEFKQPFIINAFLYPISASGLIHVAIFIILPLLFSLFIRLLEIFLVPFLDIGTAEITEPLIIIFYVIFYSYMCYYIADCVFNSSKGRQRASSVSMPGQFSWIDFVSEAVVLVGCAAICLSPIALYSAFTKRADLYFWLLLAYGVFFLPMALLRGILFEAFDALNPIEIIRSIYRVFLPYCGLVLFFLIIGGFIVAVLPRLPIWGFITQGVKIYLVFVLAHRLGWFYWWHKDKLGWGI